MSSGRTPWGRLRQRERFARAVDASAETGPETGSRTGSETGWETDPESTPDPRLAGELAVIVMLRRSAAATAPDRAARERMRASVLTRLAEERTGQQTALLPSPTPSPSPTPRPHPKPSPVPRQPGAAPRVPGSVGPVTEPSPQRPGGRHRRVTSARGRVTISLAAAFCLLIVLSGMTLLLSRNALPGDPLYGIRRSIESAALDMTGGDEAKGLKHLEYASDSVSDIETLAQQYPNVKDSPVGDYLTAFASFDYDASTGTADLTTFATSNNDGVLSTLHDWAVEQTSRIQQVQHALPGKAVLQADRTLKLLSDIAQRATDLEARNACYTITSGKIDELGPEPSGGPCDAPPTSGNAAPTNLPGSGGTVDGQNPPTEDVTPTTTPAAGPQPTSSPNSGGTGIINSGGSAAAGKTTVAPTLTVPLPLPTINVPPLLPGLPGIQIGQ